MSVKFSNNGHSTLAASITTSATSITVASGHGARFPSLSSGEYFYATLIDSSNNLEIVKCTARSSDVLTVTRAQEGTTARAFGIGDRIELRVTAAGIVDATNIDNIVPDQSSHSGKFITTDGTNVSWGAVTIPSDLGLASQQVFTSDGTWTKPSGITTIKVYVTGGGGGSGKCPGNNADDTGQGGAAGGTAIEIIDVSSVSSVTVTIGSGGTAGGSSSAGGHGGTSSFGSYCSATGGDGSTNSTNFVRAEGGVGSGGDINIYGQGPAGHGAINYNQGGQNAIGGSGGNSFWGGGGAGGNSSSAPTVGTHGGGGGGPANANGVAGGAGIVVVEEYK
tara:strand:- start:330 stop:1334 length:1005 start_codon:yes stop_codon:yes gene_type:complete